MLAFPISFFPQPTDVGFALLAMGFAVLVAKSADATRTAAVLYVLSLPLVNLPVSQHSGHPALILVVVAFVLLVLCVLRERAHAPHGEWDEVRASLPILLLLAWAAVGTAMSEAQSWDGWGRFARPAASSVVVFLAARRIAVRRAMAKAFVAAVSCVALVAIVQFFWGRFFWSIGRTSRPDYDYFIEIGPGLVRAPGTFEDPSNMGFFAACALLLVAQAVIGGASGRWHRRGLGALALTLAGGLAASLTRSAMLGAMAGLGLLCFRKLAITRRTALTLGSVIALGSLILAARMARPSEGTGSIRQRLLYWKTAGRLVTEHPILGVGLGRFDKEFVARQPHLHFKIAALRSHRPHNIFLQIPAETGLIGLVLFVGYIGPPLVTLLRRAEASSRLAAAILVAALIHASLHNVALQDLLWLVIGLALAQARPATATATTVATPP